MLRVLSLGRAGRKAPDHAYTPLTSSDPLIRPLREGEESSFLNLVADWPFTDDRRGDEFFARPMDHDPSFAISDIWGAFAGDELVACCQLFPRSLRIAGESVPTAGIGTVFTSTAHRGNGTGSAVVKAATEEIVQRGYELALLHAQRFSFYEKLGYGRWGPAKGQWQLASAVDRPRTLGPDLVIEKFDREQHLEEVVALSAMYCADRHGTIVRSADGWDVSLALAGNPVEEFVVAKDARLDQVIAFLRGCVLNGEWQVLEWACAGGHEEHLAELAAITVRTVAQAKVVAPTLADRRLERCLRDRGLIETGALAGEPEWMFQCVNPTAFSSRFGLPSAANSSEASGSERSVIGADLLNIVLPPAAFHFWTSDRF